MRVLITGLSTHWGGRLAQILERDPAVEAIIGVDKRPPKVELERTEYVRVHDQHSLIRRIVHAAEIDTIVDTRLVVDSIVTTPKLAHENNVIGTMNVLAACGGGRGSDTPVRKVVFKSSARYYGAHQDDPAFFTEAMRRPHPPRSAIESDIVEAETAVREFAERNPAITVTVLRFANGVGPDLRTSHTHLFSLPAIPSIMGFDPRYQFIHEEDMAGCLEHAVRNDLAGAYNCAADGVLTLSEVAALLGKPLLPALPPLGTGLAAGALRRLGIRIPGDLVDQLKFGRGLDNRLFKASGYRYRYTSREAIVKLREHQRLKAVLAAEGEGYRYEREVEEFLRWSPSVRRAAGIARPALANVAPGGGRTPAPAGFDDLPAEEVVALLPSLERAHLPRLRDHEAANARRPEVLRAIDALL